MIPGFFLLLELNMTDIAIKRTIKAILLEYSGSDFIEIHNLLNWDDNGEHRKTQHITLMEVKSFISEIHDENRRDPFLRQILSN